MSRLFMLTVLGAVLSAPAWAQCAMCREAASSQRAEAIQALNRGIILLAIPPAAILLGIGWLTYRYWDSPEASQTPQDPDVQGPAGSHPSEEH